MTQVNHIQEIEQMESVVCVEIYPEYEVGSIVSKTKDIRTDCGWIHLIHGDKLKVMDDYRNMCILMRTMFEVM